MRRPLVLALLVAAFAAATSPVWADGGDPTFTPDPAYPGQTASFTGTITRSGFDTAATDCTVGTDPEQTPLSFGCAYDAAGLVTGWVVVPSPWTAATMPVVICGPAAACGQVSAVDLGVWTLSAPLDVTSAPTLVVVPGTRCLRFPAARELLQQYGVDPPPRARGGPAPTYVVGSQAPSSGTTVPAGSVVTLFPAVVPAVTGLTYPSAAAAIVRACGSPSPAGDLGGNAVLTSPSAGSTVPSGSAVVVTLRTAPPPPAQTGPHHPWRWRPLALGAGAVLAVAAAALVGVSLHRTRTPPGPVAVRAAPGTPTYPSRRSGAAPARPDLIVVRHATTYWSEEPT